MSEHMTLSTDHDSDELVTIYTKASKLTTGDRVFCAMRSDRIVANAITDQWGTWIVWTDGERESFPAEYGVYRVVPA
jgi:hypothetical protein